jgi:hypothetical protein
MKTTVHIQNHEHLQRKTGISGKNTCIINLARLTTCGSSAQVAIAIQIQPSKISNAMYQWINNILAN